MISTTSLPFSRGISQRMISSGSGMYSACLPARCHARHELVGVHRRVLGVAFRVEEPGEHHRVRPAERGLICILEFPPLRGVAAGFEYRDHGSIGVLLARGVDGFADRRGVMGEVVDHRDAADRPLHLHSAAHAAEGTQAVPHAVGIRPDGMRGGDGRQAVANVERAGERRFHQPPLLAVMQHAEAGHPRRRTRRHVPATEAGRHRPRVS